MIRAHRLGILLLLAALPLLPAAAFGSETPSGEALIIGPFPLPPADAPEGPLTPRLAPAPEFDVTRIWPAEGETVALTPGTSSRWRRVKIKPFLSFPESGIYWMASRLHLNRWSELTLRLSGNGALTVFLAGQEEGRREAAAGGENETPLELRRQLHRGIWQLLVRLEFPPGPEKAGRLSIETSTAPQAELGWSASPGRTPLTYDRMRDLAAISGIAVSPEGRFIARRLTRVGPTGDARHSSIEVFGPGGELLAAEVGGPEARPLAFSPTGDGLLLARPGKEGTDLLIWDAPAGPLRLVLTGEPGFTGATFDPSGRFLLVSSSRGVEKDEGEGKRPHRRKALRERLPDYTPRTHLHLIALHLPGAVPSYSQPLLQAARREITRPGDDVLDGACFAGEGKVVYARTLPQKERPWFFTEIRELDLAGGGDRLLRRFTAGWEYRPRNFAAEPGGRRIAFLGPPEEIGEGHAEHNVYNAQVYVLDLESGALKKITAGMQEAFEVRGATTLAWLRSGRLVATASLASRGEVVLLDEGEGGSWRALPVPTPGEMIVGAGLSPEKRHLALAVSSRTQPAELQLIDLDQLSATVIERPNADLAESWRLAAPRNASFRGPGGETLDAWYYPPVFAIEPRKIPLVVYYYGGAVPTTRSFNPLHQFLAANGYGVLVINPRGACGWGEKFADVHAGDWGPLAAADILAGVDSFLAGHAEVNKATIGIYGGSYGGFMTEYLVSVTNRFAAAVSLYGISDISSYWGRGAWGWTYGDMAAGGAAPFSDRSLFAGHSPFYMAEQIETPLLLLHGEADTNVPPGESEQLYTALRTLGRDAELVLFPGEHHGISGTFTDRAEHRMMLLDWFDKYLRGQPEAWDGRWKR